MFWKLVAHALIRIIFVVDIVFSIIQKNSQNSQKYQKKSWKPWKSTYSLYIHNEDVFKAPWCMCMLNIFKIIMEFPILNACVMVLIHAALGDGTDICKCGK